MRNVASVNFLADIYIYIYTHIENSVLTGPRL